MLGVLLIGYGQIACEILAEAAETDRREDELYGEARGDELPERLRTSAGRRAALREAKAKLEREAGREAQPDSDEPEGAGVEIELDLERFVTRSHGRRAWFREARRALDERREQAAPDCALPSGAARRVSAPVGGGARGRALGNAAYEAWRQHGVAADGSRRMAPGTTKPYHPPELPAGTINTTDPDSRLVKTVGQRALQGYNAQAAVNEHQIVVAAEVTVDSPDFGHLEPMVEATQRELAIIGAESCFCDRAGSLPPPGRARSARSWRSNRCGRCWHRRATPPRMGSQVLGQLGDQRRLDHPAGQLGEQPARPGDLLRLMALQRPLARYGDAVKG